MEDLTDVYNELIMEHSMNSYNKKKLENAITHFLRGKSKFIHIYKNKNSGLLPAILIFIPTNAIRTNSAHQ